MCDEHPLVDFWEIVFKYFLSLPENSIVFEVRTSIVIDGDAPGRSTAGKVDQPNPDHPDRSAVLSDRQQLPQNRRSILTRPNRRILPAYCLSVR
jgi:hypothetical protein